MQTLTKDDIWINKLSKAVWIGLERKKLWKTTIYHIYGAAADRNPMAVTDGNTQKQVPLNDGCKNGGITKHYRVSKNVSILTSHIFRLMLVIIGLFFVSERCLL